MLGNTALNNLTVPRVVYVSYLHYTMNGDPGLPFHTEHFFSLLDLSPSRPLPIAFSQSPKKIKNYIRVSVETVSFGLLEQWLRRRVSQLSRQHK